MVLGQKYHYASVSANLTGTASDIPAIADEVVKWNGVDLVVLYHHPDLGALVVNPKNKKRIAQIDRLNRSELLVIYAGLFAKEGEPKLLEAACDALIDLFSGRKPKVKPEFLKGDCVYKPEKEEKPGRQGESRAQGRRQGPGEGPRVSAEGRQPPARQGRRGRSALPSPSRSSRPKRPSRPPRP